MFSHISSALGQTWSSMVRCWTILAAIRLIFFKFHDIVDTEADQQSLNGADLENIGQLTTAMYLENRFRYGRERVFQRLLQKLDTFDLHF